MGHEERCDKRAKDLPEELETLALSARVRSWEPFPDVAWPLLLACVELAGELRNYLEDGPHAAQV